mmetsp:Transcript_42857/g.121450  ORF Transcript_42857/g.121450 Transcript_42857/m.121450 type:complete len:286 (-) Transcript_42857:463-1320(-)
MVVIPQASRPHACHRKKGPKRYGVWAFRTAHRGVGRQERSTSRPCVRRRPASPQEAVLHECGVDEVRPSRASQGEILTRANNQQQQPKQEVKMSMIHACALSRRVQECGRQTGGQCVLAACAMAVWSWCSHLASGCVSVCVCACTCALVDTHVHFGLGNAAVMRDSFEGWTLLHVNKPLHAQHRDKDHPCISRVDESTDTFYCDTVCFVNHADYWIMRNSWSVSRVRTTHQLFCSRFSRSTTSDANRIRTVVLRVGGLVDSSTVWALASHGNSADCRIPSTIPAA